MVVMVNGESKQVAATDIAALLGELDYGGAYIAVALNSDVVPRDLWRATPLKDGDAIEILTPRQGG